MTESKQPPQASDFEKVKRLAEDMVPGLQRGIGEIALFRKDIEPELRLADTFCGPVSLAIARRLTANGIENVDARKIDQTSTKKRWRLSSIEHVIAVVDQADTIIIDGTYREHFRPFGLDHWFAHSLYPHDPYPPEQIMVFRASETADIAARMIHDIELFWDGYSNSPQFRNRWGNSVRKPAVDVPYAELLTHFEQLWDLNRYKPYDAPPNNVRNDAERLLAA